MSIVCNERDEAIQKFETSEKALAISEAQLK